MIEAAKALRRRPSRIEVEVEDVGVLQYLRPRLGLGYLVEKRVAGGAGSGLSGEAQGAGGKAEESARGQEF